MNVLMLGWEFPPFISGGLGTACYGLTKAMDQLGVNITFLLPRVIDDSCTSHVRLISPQAKNTYEWQENSKYASEKLKNVKFRTIDSPLQPYDTPEVHQQRLEQIIERKRLMRQGIGQKSVSSPKDSQTNESAKGGDNYGRNLHEEVHRYAEMAADVAASEHFDIVHAHDWMTFPAGIAVAATTHKPLVVHVHSTEFDRSGEHVNQIVYDIERKGMHAADKVIAVSNLTRNIVIDRYGVTPEKVEVVHNGVQRDERWQLVETGIEADEKIVLFLGRITMQKGPEYFLQAAKKVLEAVDNVKFVMAGSGDLMHRSVQLAAELGIGHKVLFTGFLRGDDIKKIYQMADLYVMPSVSEPFGIVPLEALGNDVPIIISKQSGVSEVLMHALKVDFWDVNEIANKIVAVLKYPPLQITLRNYGNFEVRKLRWGNAAIKCINVYKSMLQPA